MIDDTFIDGFIICLICIFFCFIVMAAVDSLISSVRLSINNLKRMANDSTSSPSASISYSAPPYMAPLDARSSSFKVEWDKGCLEYVAVFGKSPTETMELPSQKNGGQ